MADLEQLFSSVGTQFLVPLNIIQEKLDNVNAFLFDWDGVFNDGTKGHEVTSHFTEVDSMGINMLRFSYWLKTGELPYCAIITGRHNKSALNFAEREHFHAVCMGYTHKLEALEFIGAEVDTSAFFFDDILDLSVASQCKLRILIGRAQSPLMTETVKDKGWCEIITGSTGGDHALREACELLIGSNGNWDSVLGSRVAFDDKYRAYLLARNSVTTVLNEKSR